MTDISGPVSSASQLDELVWTKVDDQFGATKSDNLSTYNGLTTATFDGVTYVVGTQTRGDVDLWTYDSTTKSLTLMASFEGSDNSATNMTDPELLFIDGKVVIYGGTESNYVRAYSYDPALGPSTVDNDNRLVVEQGVSAISNAGWGNGDDMSFTFQASNGEHYVLTQSEKGAFNGGRLFFDANDNLQIDKTVNSTNTYRDTTMGPDEANVIVGEERTTELAENFNQLDEGYTSQFHQVGDVVYEYVAGNTNFGNFHVVKWEVDPVTGILDGAQVIYTDGTTTADLSSLGITSQPYPAVSPFDNTSLPLNSASFPGSQYLNQIAQSHPDIDGLGDLPDGSLDAIDFKSIRAISTFEYGGETYMFVGTWSSNQDGAAVFRVDPNTGLPIELIDIVEGENSNADDADDAHFAFATSNTTIQVSTVDATGELVISSTGDNSIMYFKFDPTGGFGSGDTVNTGALTWIGSEGGGGTYNADTSGSTYLSTPGLNEHVIMPDGSMLTANNDSLWLADAGLSTLQAAVCFVSGTYIDTLAGPVPVEKLKIGDMIKTRDHGFQTLRWVGSQRLGKKLLRSNPKLYPIRIGAGALGENYPQRDLYVSPQHRMLVSSEVIKKMLGKKDALVAANQLLDFENIEKCDDVNDVVYLHLLFDRHEIIYANGAEAESLYTGPEALRTLTSEARAEIFTIFPELETRNYNESPAATVLKGKLLKKFLFRTLKNNKQLFAPA